MSLPHLSPLLLATLAACAVSTPMHPPTPAATPAINGTSVHVGCAQVQPGMNYREALALMGRTPDSTLSGHTAAGPDGNPPAGSYAIDFWNDIDAQGLQRVSSLHYSGGVVDSVDCGRPVDDPASPLPSHSPGT
ncbi:MULTISPECIES: hypothetical protein [unclassified Luteimonas]